MNLRERFNKTMHFQKVDRGINMEFGYWDETVEKWYSEGLSEDLKYIPKAPDAGKQDPLCKFFGIDMQWRGCFVNFNNNGPMPAFEEKVLAEDEESVTKRTAEGTVFRISKKMASIPHYIKFPIETKEDWKEYKLRFNPNSKSRYPDNWDEMVERYRNRDYPLGININGFFGQLRNLMGFENLSYAWHDQPDLIREVCEFWADYSIKVSQRVFEEVELDFVHFWEDMAFNHGAMVSPKHFRQFLTPAYKKVIEFIKNHGIDVIIVDTDGLIDELIPLFLEVGVNGILPIEIAAGNDPIAWRKKYGKDLRMLGGIDKRALARCKKDIEDELKKISVLISKGGYIPALDHLVPPDVSLDKFKFYMKLKKEVLK